MSGLLLGGTAGDGARAGGRVGDLDPAGLRRRRSGNGDAQDTIGIIRREVVGVHALTQGELPGERALRPLGDDDVLAVAVARDALALIVKVPCSTVTSMVPGSTPGRSAST